MTNHAYRWLHNQTSKETYRTKFKRMVENNLYEIKYEDEDVLLANKSDDKKMLFVRFYKRRPNPQEIKKLKKLKVERGRFIECIVCPKDKRLQYFDLITAKKGMFN